MHEILSFNKIQRKEPLFEGKKKIEINFFIVLLKRTGRISLY